MKLIKAEREKYLKKKKKKYIAPFKSHCLIDLPNILNQHLEIAYHTAKTDGYSFIVSETSIFFYLNSVTTWKRINYAVRF